MQLKLQLVWNSGQSTKENIWKAGETSRQNSSSLTLGSNSTEVSLLLSVAKQMMEELCKSLETHNSEMKCLNSDRFLGEKKRTKHCQQPVGTSPSFILLNLY